MTHLRNLIPLLAVGLLLPGLPSWAGDHEGNEHEGNEHEGNENVCEATNAELARACDLSAREESRVAAALCLNLADETQARQCRRAARKALREALAECTAQEDARDELCEVPGFEGPYDPRIDPGQFVPGIHNPLAPFRVGSRWVYQKKTEEGIERIEVKVLDETRQILGIECTVVRDRVWLDGTLVEDTVDWVAQDVEGNVWYMGEIAKTFGDGLLRSLDGSWEAGVDGAKPGFWMKGAPREGELYRQEWLPGEAEDVVEVLSLDAEVDSVPFANGNPVPPDPGFHAAAAGQGGVQVLRAARGACARGRPRDGGAA